MTTLEHYPARFEAVQAEIGERDPNWLTPLRKAALDHWNGVPTKRHEEWKYTSLRGLGKIELEPVVAPNLGGATPETLAHLALEDTAVRLVFVNGHYAPELSETSKLSENSNVVLCSLGEAFEKHADKLEPHLNAPLAGGSNDEVHPFAALNVAFARDGLFLHVPRGAAFEGAIHMLHVVSALDTSLVASPRHLVVLEESAQATIIEQYASLSESPALVNARAEIVLAQNAVLDHVRVQQENDVHGYHISTLAVRQARDSVYRNVAFNLGGKLVRNDLGTHLGGTNVESTFNGLYLARDKQHIDNHTVIDHAHPHCNSWEVYKGILDGQATAVFNGKVYVRQIAQRTDAKQSNMNLLLSDEATINTKPQLEIWADDVRCTHGATVGHLDEDALFYLRTRCIGAAEAREMLILGFAREIIEMVKLESLRNKLESELLRWMPTRRGEEKGA